MNYKIAIIGAGNMGQAIAQGLLRKKVVNQDQLILTSSKTNNNKEAVEKVDIVILAIKPQVTSIVLEEIKDTVKNQLIISIMAGTRINSIQQTLGRNVAIIRVMPNLAAQVGQSMSVWVKNKHVTKAQEKIVKIILSSIGKELQLKKEKQIDAVTALSGSGPAYFFYVAELLEKAAQELGFSQMEASMLVKQTLLGSAELLHISHQSAEKLRNVITSKGGTTEAALNQFKEDHFDKIVKKGVIAAYKRAKQLGRQ